MQQQLLRAWGQGEVSQDPLAHNLQKQCRAVLDWTQQNPASPGQRYGAPTLLLSRDRSGLLAFSSGGGGGRLPPLLLVMTAPGLALGQGTQLYLKVGPS